MSDECSNQIKMCKLDFHPCQYAGREDECPNHSVNCGGNNIPSFEQWVKIYYKLANERHQQNGQLSKESIRSVISVLKQFVQVMGYSMTDKVNLITRKTIQEYINRLTGIKDISRKAKAQSIQRCFSRWIRFAVEDEWDVPKFDLPELKDDSERFHDPTPEQILKIKLLFRSLYGKGGGTRRNRDYLYMAMSLHYAMRNGDINRLQWSNIKMIDGRPRLEYTPHKTRLSSKRKLKIWMNPIDYHDLMEFKERIRNAGYPYNDDSRVFGDGRNLELQSRLNGYIGELGINDSKKLYICRKICISETYKAHGKEACVAISGDNFSTIAYHYADQDSLEVEPPSSLCM